MNRQHLSIGEPQQTVWYYVDRFEEHLRAGEVTSLADFLPATESSCYSEVAGELLRIQLEFDWSQQKPGSLDRLRTQYADLPIGEDIWSHVAFEDYRQRRLRGEAVAPAEYAAQYGIATDHWDPQIESDIGMFPSIHGPYGETWKGARNSTYRRPVAADHRPYRNSLLPIGSVLGEFELVAELGQGAFSRVYVAEQTTLAKRLVVLKLTTVPLGESQLLARLQHANILPLYSAHQFDSLFALCTPWLGTATLGDWIQILEGGHGSAECRTTSVSNRAGDLATLIETRRRTVWEQISLRQPDWQAPTWNRNPDWLIDRYGAMSREQAILTIGLRLAEALHHAHQRGILHRDIKPANILLADDGEPVLMDFNLSRDFTESNSQPTVRLGGTLPYMAPEVLRAMQGDNIIIDRAADIYSLGVVLYQALTGHLPHEFDPACVGDWPRALAKRREPIPPIRAMNPHISPGAEAIIMRCLADVAQDRYQAAGHLAEDFRLHLAHRPLRHVANPSLRERVQKFSRRHPQLVSNFSMLTAACLALALMLGVGLQYRRSSLEQQGLRAAEQFRRAAHRAEAALFFADGGSWSRGQELGRQALSILEANTNPHWAVRGRVAYLPLETQHELKRHVDYLRQLIADPAHAHRVRGDEISAEQPILLASARYAARDFRGAFALLDAALEREPQRFALWFLKGKCLFELREYRSAGHCFAMASLIEPDSAIAHLAHGLCHYWMNHDAEAWAALDQAEKLEPEWIATYINKALVRERQQRWDEALIQIDRGLSREPESLRLLMARSRIRRKAGDVVGAEHDLEQVKQTMPQDPEGWILRGIARLSESPSAALEDFRQAAQWPSMAITARQNMAHVLSEHLHRPEEAVAVLSELLIDAPEFLPALAGRAVLFARLQQIQQALEDLDRLKRMELTPQAHYQIACAYALISGTDSKYVEWAFHHLSLALRPAYGAEVLANDEDLKPLESHAAFRRLRQTLEWLNLKTQKNTNDR